MSSYFKIGLILANLSIISLPAFADDYCTPTEKQKCHTICFQLNAVEVENVKVKIDDLPVIKTSILGGGFFYKWKVPVSPANHKISISYKVLLLPIPVVETIDNVKDNDYIWLNTPLEKVVTGTATAGYAEQLNRQRLIRGKCPP